MARNEQLIRQHRLLQLLERYRFGRTVEELRDDLVEELGLSSLHPRSVQRDLSALQAAGIDINVHAAPRGKIWKLGPQARGAFKITASATELIALLLSRDLLYPLAGTPFWMGIESFWSKLQEELPEAVWDHYVKYRQTLYVGGMPAKSYVEQHGILSTLHRGIVEHRVVEVEYHPIGKDVQRRKIEPYAVVFFHSSLYIIAAAREVSSGGDRLRHFKLDRFQKADLLDEYFKRPADFDLEKYLGQSAGIFLAGKARDFRIRVSAHATPWVREDPWHPEQTLETQPDGSAILTVRAAHDLEIIPRVLAMGTEAEILSPASCRKTMATIMANLAEKYAK